MEHGVHGVGMDPGLTVALALAIGLIAQAVAQHIRVPGIVVLLVAGAILGPDVLNIVQPETLGTALHTLVGYAVAVILFEGGLNLQLSRLLRQSSSIQRLITGGSLITAVGGALAAHYLLGWDWRLSFLFGTLVIVTGPTVIGPLLRRIRIRRDLQTILEAEGVLIDPVGAIIAIVALDVMLQPSVQSMMMGLLGVGASLGIGTAIGFAGGYIMALVLRARHLIPDGLENVFTLSMVLALFHIANSFQTEAGIAAVTIAGVVVGNVRTRVRHDLMEFKEQLTVMLIGMLFVLLAADVRFSEIQALGWRGVATVLVLMLIVRPINIWFGTMRSPLSWRDKAFLSWIAPRGIVAAAVASFFSIEMQHAGIEGGPELRAMVFLVIAMTVTIQGLTGGFVAQAFGVRRPSDRGYAILGANDLGLAVGRALREGGEDVIFLDSNTDASHAAQRDGFRVVFGNALEETTMQRAGLDGLAGCVGLTPNEEINLLFSTKVRKEFKVRRAYAAMLADEGHVTDEMVRDSGNRVLFGGAQDLRLWEACVRRNVSVSERWVYRGNEPIAKHEGAYIPSSFQNVLLPLARKRGGQIAPVDGIMTFRDGDEVTFLMYSLKRDEGAQWLADRGWEPVQVEAVEEQIATPA